MSPCLSKPARLIGLLAMSLLLMGAEDLRRLPAPPPGPAFAVVARTPDAEIRFRGMTLREARQNPGLNEITIAFAEPEAANLFEQVAGALPEWVEFAYAGYDSAVIRAKVAATFEVTPEEQGFTLRIVRREAGDDVAVELSAEQARLAALRGQPDEARAVLDELRRDNPDNPLVLRSRAAVEAGVGDWHAAERYYALALAETPGDESLRGSLEDSRREIGPQAGLATEWRHSSGQDIYSGTVSGRIPLRGRFSLAGDVRGVRAEGDDVQRLDGTITSLEQNGWSASLGALYRMEGGGEVRAGAMYSPAGFGLQASSLWRTVESETELSGTYRAAYLDTAEAVATDASRDQAQLRHARRIAQGLWGEAALRYTRYNVDGSDEAGQTAGFTASLRFLREFFGWSGGIAYEIEGEYVVDATQRPDAFGATFVPLGLREREIHALSGSASAPLGRDFWLDAYAGWALDRYGGDGPFGGLAVRYTAFPGFDISAGISHSGVPGRQGESGSTTTAGVNLLYKMQGAANDE